MNAAAETTTDKPKPMSEDLLASVEVLKPDACAEKVKKYICRIRRTEENKRFEFQIRVGPACFATETFRWDGKGETARQEFRPGAIQEFSDAQVKEIQEKLRFRYLRVVRGPGPDGRLTGAVVGFNDIDASDGGDANRTRTPALGQKEDDGLPRRLNRRLRGDETPLKDLLIFERVYENEKFGGRTVTVESLKAMLAEAEAEEARELEAGDSVFETGRGGKAEKKRGAEDRDPKTLAALSTTDGNKKAAGGYLGK